MHQTARSEDELGVDVFIELGLVLRIISDQHIART